MRCYDAFMQVTITVDDDVLAVAKDLAEREGISLGSALSELVRRGLKSAISIRDDGMPVFKVPNDSVPITSEDVYQELDRWP